MIKKGINFLPLSYKKFMSSGAKYTIPKDKKELKKKLRNLIKKIKELEWEVRGKLDSL